MDVFNRLYLLFLNFGPRHDRKRSGMLNIGTFESERSNSLELIVENVHGTVTVRSGSSFKNERNTV
jgi:hypothetical protein